LRGRSIIAATFQANRARVPRGPARRASRVPGRRASDGRDQPKTLEIAHRGFLLQKGEIVGRGTPAALGASELVRHAYLRA